MQRHSDGLRSPRMGWTSARYSERWLNEHVYSHNKFMLGTTAITGLQGSLGRGCIICPSPHNSSGHLSHPED